MCIASKYSRSAWTVPSRNSSTSHTGISIFSPKLVQPPICVGVVGGARRTRLRGNGVGRVRRPPRRQSRAARRSKARPPSPMVDSTPPLPRAAVGLPRADVAGSLSLATLLCRVASCFRCYVLCRLCRRCFFHRVVVNVGHRVLFRSLFFAGLPDSPTL
jgi:hypothetical protein